MADAVVAVFAPESCQAESPRNRQQNDSQPTSKSFAAHPYSLPSAAQHMLFSTYNTLFIQK